MWWKILIVVFLLQIPLGVLVGRFIKLGNPITEQELGNPRKVRDRLTQSKAVGALSGMPRELRNTCSHYRQHANNALLIKAF